MSTSLETLVSQMTVSELAQRSGISVGTLVELAFGSRGAATPTRSPAAAGGRKRGRKPKAAAAKPAKAAAKAAPKAEASKPSKAGVDTRAPSGRAKYDEAVLAAIKGAKGRVKAGDLRKKVGGTPLQIRTALHRLLTEGKIKSQGKARGTTYSG
ncbi:MAG: hypothetical protein K1X88_00135 [Nannocystaceae bacterium]|nr:hypothetical protein [Nannocystaceae bacterium]